ncbi:hypothetical protein H4R35_000950 [Dimargaris xerosporica]|nr:hypothetical protein H4R35_000950 [Dimargaris xerosporica]
MSMLPTDCQSTGTAPMPAEPMEWKCLTQATIDQLHLVVHPFTGSLEDAMWSFWYAHATSVINGLLPNLASPVKLAAPKTVLDPLISKEIDHACLTTWAQFLAHMGTYYPNTHWSNHYLVGLQGKTLFKVTMWDIHALSSVQLEAHIQRIIKEVKLGQTCIQIQHDFTATCPTASKPTAKPAPTTEPAPTPAEDNKAKQRC